MPCEVDKCKHVVPASIVLGSILGRDTGGEGGIR